MARVNSSIKFKQSGALIQYSVSGQLITHAWDPSHLIKTVRNNFETKNISHFITNRWQSGKEDEVGSLQIGCWDDIDKLYRLDLRSTPQRRLENLTEEHLKPTKDKMKVSTATQVLSETCGTVMLEYVEKGLVEPHFVSTAQIILFMNDIFDSINGSHQNPTGTLKSSVSRESIHFEYWEYAVWMLQNMFFVYKLTGERNNRSTVLQKFESTIRGYREVAQICFDAGISKLDIRYFGSEILT